MTVRRVLLGLVGHALALGACGGESTSDPSAPAATPVTAFDAGAASAEADAAASTCPTAGAAESTSPLASAAITEPSGIAASRLNPGVFWVHNDSGDSARAFAVDRTGALLTTLVFDTAPAVDIEDMAIEDAPDGSSYLYFADIGDNAGARSDYLVHRVREPRVGAEASITTVSEKMTVRYPDGSHDAETLLFDPRTKDLFIVTKIGFGRAAIHRVGPFVAGGTATTTRIAGVSLALATGGAISRDGSLIAIRSYTSSASLWRRAPGEDLVAVFARAACKVPIAAETQGEAFAFLVDGSGYVTVSEGAQQPLHVSRFQ